MRVMKSHFGSVVETNTLSSNSSASVNDGRITQPVCANAAAGSPPITPASASPAISAFTRARRRAPYRRRWAFFSIPLAHVIHALYLQPLPAHVDPAGVRDTASHEPPERGVLLAQQMRVDEPLHRGLAAQPRAALDERRHALRGVAARRDLELLVEPAEDALDALARGADEPAQPVIGDPETQVDQHGELE